MVVFIQIHLATVLPHFDPDYYYRHCSIIITNVLNAWTPNSSTLYCYLIEGRLFRTLMPRQC
jgi:hypothetical protein